MMCGWVGDSRWRILLLLMLLLTDIHDYCAVQITVLYMDDSSGGGTVQSYY
jgi:hypothetical protein